jgi:hypothetical protein
MNQVEIDEAHPERSEGSLAFSLLPAARERAEVRG